MTDAELQHQLTVLLALPAETEWVEFKAAKTSLDLEKIGVYFSALSNEANLKGQTSGWLIFGVTDKPPRRSVGTSYRADRPSLDALKKQIADQTSSRLTFEEIHELMRPEGRVLMFQIPAALRGMPTAWKGHEFGRDGESIGALNHRERESIRHQSAREDWSAQPVPGATLADLDPQALTFAREQYRQKHPTQAGELAGWDDATFLDKAKVTSGRRITRTALLLLGTKESAHFLSPAQAQVTWVLRDEKNIEKDYRHFGQPLILAGDQVLAKIRNLTVRQLPSGTLFPHEVTQYDPWVIRETLHNCIAHQDYPLGGRINVVERADTLLFTNLGSFIPGTVEQMIQSAAPPDVYRNSFLAQAMVNLNMIDTIGSGIKRMFTRQRERSFPLPDYELGEPNKVVVRLKQRHLIEGRRPNIFVAAKIAEATGDKAAYIRNRAFDKEHYKAMIVAYLEKFGQATRANLDELLLGKLSDALNAGQKKRSITNLLQEMRLDGTIIPNGTTRWVKWRMSKTPDNPNL